MSNTEYLYYLKHIDQYGKLRTKEQIERVKIDYRNWLLKNDNYKSLLKEEM